MYRLPSRRKTKKAQARPNLIPILDAVFIFIFFLLMSANFIKIYEIQSDVPIISSRKPPKNKKKPLNLTLQISESKKVYIKSGLPLRTMRSISPNRKGDINYEAVHTYLVSLKKRFPQEKDIVLEPLGEKITYDELVKIMDSARMLRNTDDPIYIKTNQAEGDIKVKELFNNIVFGNIQS